MKLVIPRVFAIDDRTARKNPIQRLAEDSRRVKNRFYEAPSHLAGERIEVRFDPLDPALVEIYFEGKPEATARLVDAVLNGQLPSYKPARPAPPPPTGINLVDLLVSNKSREEPPW